MESRKLTRGEKIFNIFNVAFLSLVMVITIYPFLYVIFASFSEPSRLMQQRGLLLAPLGFTIEGYKMVFANPSIISGYGNTIIYVVLGTALNLFATSLAAYGLSRKDVYWAKYIMMMITFTMFFGGGMIPTYLLMKNLHLLNTRWVLIIPGAVAVWNLIIMKTSFEGIPASLEEAAKIDGANELVILWKIILPLSKATLAVMALFYAVGHWNSWFSAMIYLRDRELYPLQLILREILILNDTSNMQTITDQSQLSDFNQYKTLVQYCTIIVATGPILLVYPFLQKYFVKGVLVGGVKG
ncbi:MAG: carbohydrate ABC transporter permease [Cellulosilyticaceae bacterium]